MTFIKITRCKNGSSAMALTGMAQQWLRLAVVIP
jgi:hypothetical protein